MNMLSTIAHRLGFERRAADPSWAALGSNHGYPAVMSARGAENLSAVLACVGAVSSALSSIPALVYRRESAARQELETHALTRLVRHGVSEVMTWPEFIEHWIASALLHGNGLAEIERDARGELLALHFIPWGNVTVVKLGSGRLRFDVTDDSGSVRRLLQSEVLHLRDRTDDGLVGRSRLSRAANAVASVSAGNEFARSFLDHGAMPSGVLSSDLAIGPEQWERLRSSLAERHGGARKAGRVMILDGGLKWSQAQVSPEDAQLLETRKFGVEEICRLFMVPPPLVQDYSHNTFTNSETAGRWFAMFCLTPWARKVEAEFCRSLFPRDSGEELELDLSGFLRGDPATRWQAHSIALSNGVLDADEVRQVEGWNPRPAPAPPVVQ